MAEAGVGPEAGAAGPELPTDDDATGQNIAAVLDFYSREEQRISRSQRVTEEISHFVGQPVFIAAVLAFVALWMGVNQLLQALQLASFDAPPFPWLQGVVSLSALLTSTIVLIRQNRLAKLAEQRDHLDLKVILLTEQKAAKMIHLIEELRRDLPNVRDRHDSTALALQQAMNPSLVLAALDQRTGASEALVPGLVRAPLKDVLPEP